MAQESSADACEACGHRHGSASSCSTLVRAEGESVPSRPRCVPVEVDPLVGTKLGSFRLVRRLGRGGMGAVYLGEHVSIGSRVAVKVLHEHLATYPELVQRFHAEARAVNVIGHENIVSIFDLNAGPPRPYLIMEYLDGAPLSAWVGSPLPAPAVVSVLSQVCDALQAAHLSGIVHRDLKPDNVFLVRRGRGTPFVKVLDFGIAKLADANMPQTHAGIIVGTPEYMAPEQSLSRRVDGRADLYALGVIAYQLVTGRLPFEDEGLTAQLVAHQMRAPPPPRSVHAAVPVSLERVILRALAKTPEERYATAAILRAALEGALAEELHVRSRQVRPVEPAVRARSVPAPVAGPGPVAGEGRNALPVPVMLETDLPEPVSNGSVAPRQARPVEGVKPPGARPVEGARSEEARPSPPGLVHTAGEVSTSGGPRPSPRAQVSQPVDARVASAGARPSPPVPVQSPMGATPPGPRPSPPVPVQSPMGATPPGPRPSPPVSVQSPMGATPPGPRPSPPVPVQSSLGARPLGARPSPSVPVQSSLGAMPSGSRLSPVQSPIGAMPPGAGAVRPAPMQARASVEARPEDARRPSPSPAGQARPSIDEKSAEPRSPAPSQEGHARQSVDEKPAEARRPSPLPHGQARPAIDAKPAAEARRPSPPGMARPRTDEMPAEARRPSSPGSPPRVSDVPLTGRPSSDRRDAPMPATPNHSAPAAPLSSGRSMPPVPTPKGVAPEDSVAPWSPVANLASRNWGAAVQNASGASPPVLHPAVDGAHPSSPSEVSQAARPRTVELPVRVVLRPGETPVWLTASDLSRGGLFLRSDGLLPPLFARLPLVLELESGPQSVVCEVVRHVPAEQAQVWGMPTGFGVQFVEATLALKSSVDALLRAGPGRRVAPPASSPTDDKEAAHVLEAYRARLTGDHYAVLAVPPDLDMGSLRRCTREARGTLESLRQRPLSSSQSLLLDSVLTRLHEAGEVLGTVTQRALYDAWRGNHRGVARCLEAGLTSEQLESLRREFLTRRPQSAGMARVHYLSGSALEREGQLARALETYERGLALDPLESSLHHRYRSVRRALDARGTAAEPSNERARSP
ncbi:serine/threonine-protein kinase [Myxococcus fulvus 124B02]|nr:serine/threonine-protein kinase [Myxococcus fulvus 124B02]